MKKWQRYLLLSVLVLIVLAILLSMLFKPMTKKLQPTSTSSTTQKQQGTGNVNVPQINFHYPMTDYESRLKVRWYGKYVDSSQTVSPCGAPFTGYHTGDDLETTTSEQDAEVPVYAISDATVKSVGYVSGYGGLIVLETNIGGQQYTLYFGHINLGSTNLKAGDYVVSGQKLAILGAACSIQTDVERKHLHFAIHKGGTTDVRGYVPDQAELSAWINPKDFLKNINAQ